MAHGAQNEYFRRVRDKFPDHFSWSNVLEVGSLNINGSVRDLFSTCNYIGCDVGHGPGVDIVVPGQELRFRNNSFDTAISAECFEHNPYWVETFTNMTRMTRPGGLVTFTCAGEGRPEHGTTRSDVGSSPLTVGLGWDYYRNLTPQDFKEEDILGDFSDFEFEENTADFDLYFWGIKA